MAHTPANPFRFEGPVPSAALMAREAERAALVEAAQAHRVVSVAAPRRYGKTSLLRAVGQTLHDEHGFVVAHVDLQQLAGVEDFVARFGSAWRAATKDVRRARRQLESVAGGLSAIGVSLLGSGVQFTRRERDPESALAAAHALLDLPGDCAEPVLVVLDEFQDLHAAWPAGEGVLRSHTQSPAQAGVVSYAFAGSEPSLLAAAFDQRGRAYYQQVLRIPIGRLPDQALASGISERFEATGKQAGPALGPLLALSAGHPQRAMLLAHELWNRTRREQSPGDEDWQAALASVRRQVSDECVAVWAALSAAQRAALRAVLQSGSPTSADAPAAKASRQRAAGALLGRGIIELDERPGPRGGQRYRLVDPLLGDWLGRAAERASRSE